MKSILKTRKHLVLERTPSGYLVRKQEILENKKDGESGARRGTDVRRDTPSISARKCCIQLLLPGTNHPLPFLV
jgi:hypothetical protein